MSEITEAVQLWRIRKTICEMCDDRGYLVTPMELDETLEEFIQFFGEKPDRSQLSKRFSHTLDYTDEILIVFQTQPTVSLEMLREMKRQMQNENIKHAILITVSFKSISFAALKEIEDYSTQYIIHVFAECELLINVAKHKLVPEHILMTPDEKQQLLEKYKIRDTHLPRILITDPVVRYLGVPKGSVLKIIRKSETSGRYITYRLVA